MLGCLTGFQLNVLVLGTACIASVGEEKVVCGVLYLLAELEIVSSATV